MTVMRRIAALFAALALALSAPGLVGIAHADDEDNVIVPLTSAQVTAVTAARADYLKAAWQAKITYRADVTKARDAMDTALQSPRLNVLLAKDAYEVAVRYGGDVAGTKAALDTAVASYRSAYTSALATARTATDSARAALRTALDAAKAKYVAAITASFPGTSVPRGLLNPPGPKMGWFQDHDGWMGLAKEFGLREKFDMGWPMGMGWAWGHD